MSELELISETTCQVCGALCTDAVCEECGPDSVLVGVDERRQNIDGSRRARQRRHQEPDPTILTTPGGDGL